METLESRLRGRGSESESDILARLANAASEIVHIPTLADAVIINHSSWETGYPEMKNLVQKWFKI